jgi:uncharacterized membrane protein (DUF485 family)
MSDMDYITWGDAITLGIVFATLTMVQIWLMSVIFSKKNKKR